MVRWVLKFGKPIGSSNHHQYLDVWYYTIRWSVHANSANWKLLWWERVSFLLHPYNTLTQTNFCSILHPYNSTKASPATDHTKTPTCEPFPYLPRLSGLGPTPLLRRLLPRLWHLCNNSCFISEPPLRGLRRILRSRPALPILDPKQRPRRDRHIGQLRTIPIRHLARHDIHVDVRDAQRVAHPDLVVVDVPVADRPTPNRNAAAGAEVLDGRPQLAEPDAERAQLEVGGGEERVDAHGLEEPRRALPLLV